MKSSSNDRPAIILPLGNGSYHYNYNVVEEKVEDPEAGERTVYKYDTVQIWQKPNHELLTRAVIREEIDETKEFSYVNDYNAAVLGILTGEAAEVAKASYKEYLNFIVDVKEKVKNDLAEAKY